MVDKNDLFLVCMCYSDEHTLRFQYFPEDSGHDHPSLYTSVFLNETNTFWQRIWVAIKYIFGYKCKYGDWDCFEFTRNAAQDLLVMLEDYLARTEEVNELLQQ